MNALYHYCSVDSFLAILRSKKLWLSDSSQMNDSHEGVWGDRIVEEILAEKKRIGAITEKEYLDFVFGYSHNRPRPFIFCLSSAPDILSQWRAYADDGRGVSIGFDSAMFPRQQHLPMTNADPGMNIALWPVEYSLQGQKQAILKLLDNSEFSGQFGSTDASINYQLLGSHLTCLNPMLKNPAFEEEKEWRLIHTPQLRTNSSNSHSVFGSNYSHNQRVSNGRIITYFEFPMPSNLMTVIRDVWIGPRSLLTVGDVKLALGINGFGEISVHQSSATYR